ncbi:MAG: ArsC/Spx/MgsR family protein [Chitinophagaceae bacterium]
MKKIYHLASCSTCQGIISDNDLAKKGFEMQNIRVNKITGEQLDGMKQLSGSYESLFSRRALKYKELGLKDRQLTEKDYRTFILQEDTFLKRPVIILGKQIFIGSEKKNLEALKKALLSSGNH